MPRLSAALVLGICWALGTLGATPQLSAQEPGQKPADKPAAAVSWQAQIETALQKPVTADFTETSLTDVAAFVGKQSGQLVLIDQKALDNVGVGAGTPVTCKFANISLRSVLRHVLRPLGLRFVLRDGALVITSPEEAEKLLQEEVFDVTDLVTDLVRPAGMGEELARRDCDALISAIVDTVDPQSWSAVGGPGSLDSFRGRLVVSHQREVHEKVRLWLAAYRKAKQLAEENVDKTPPVPSLPNEMNDAATAEVHRALEKEITLQFRETPLGDVVEYLRQVTKVNIAIDRHALDNLGVGTDTPISFEAQSMQLRHALRHMLSPIGCSWCVRDQVLLLTSGEEGEQELVTKAYPVADLLGRTDGADLFGNPRRPATVEKLEELLTTTIAPQTWSAVGGPGSVAHCAPIDVLIISQVSQIHEQITDLLGLLRRNLAQPPEAAAADKARPRNETTRLVVYGLPTAPKSPPAQALGGNVVPTADSLGPPIPEEQLVQLVAELIEPESWKSRKDVYLRAVPGRLLVRHTEAVQRQVQELFSHLGVRTWPLSAAGGAAVGGHDPGGMSAGGSPGGGM